jgi:hypothetical protein
LPQSIDSAFAGALSRREQLAFGAARECLGAHAAERLKRGAQLLAGVAAAPFAAQPLPVEKLRPGKLETSPAPGEIHDRLAVETVGDWNAADLDGRTSSEIDADLVAGARVVKTANTLSAEVLASDPHQAGGSA